MSQNIKTIYHRYSFNISRPNEKEAWDELCQTMNNLGVNKMHAYGDYYNLICGVIEEMEIELETTHLFNNQWNTAPIAGESESGFRVFDFAQDFLENQSIKRGHYLTQTPEMKEIRNTTLQCGYCGNHSKEYGFCDKCLDSPYLKDKDLFLLKFKPISENSDRPQLTEEEQAELLPKYLEAQTTGAIKRRGALLVRQRQEAIEKAAQDKKNLENELKGKLWLLDRGMSLENVIYYDHSKKFGFGWRQPVGGALKSHLLDIISEFPFSYEIKCEDGKTLSGY